MKKILVVNAIDLEQIPLQFPETEVRMILSGIGKTNAAMNVMQAVMEFRPDYVLNVGSTGTLNHQVGDIIVSHHFVDRDLERMKLFGLEYNITTVCPAGLENLPSVLSGRETLDDLIVNTGDDFVTAGEALTGDAVDMEVFAEAMVCRKMNLPLLSIKYVTDIVGQNSVAAWEEKLADAREGLLAFFNKNVSFFA